VSSVGVKVAICVLPWYKYTARLATPMRCARTRMVCPLLLLGSVTSLSLSWQVLLLALVSCIKSDSDALLSLIASYRLAPVL
jgi:hypothetical protein